VVGRIHSIKHRAIYRVSIKEIDNWILHNVESFKYLDSILTNNGICTREIKFRIVMAKSAINKKTLFYYQIGLEFEEETSKMLHLEHGFVWC
jgi:hypothetical protein